MKPAEYLASPTPVYVGQRALERSGRYDRCKLRIQVARLTEKITRLIEHQAPWTGMDEMQARYDVTSKTSLAMEKRGDIPTRVRGRWLRTEVTVWERSKPGR